MSRREAFAYALAILWDLVPLWVGVALIPVAMVVGAVSRAAVCSL